LKKYIAKLKSQAEAHGQGIDASEELLTFDWLPSLEAWIGGVYVMLQGTVIFAL
jgi:hypothetical protein